MTERFILQPSQEQGFWVATDKENGIVVKFKEHQFNETQQVTLLEDADPNDCMKLAKAMSEIADWLRANHYNKAMPAVSIRLIMGDHIRQLRTDQNLTQQELADKAGITRANLSNIEAGKYNVSLSTMYKIACALGKEVKIV